MGMNTFIADIFKSLREWLFRSDKQQFLPFISTLPPLPADDRDIPIASFQPAVYIPDSCKTQMPPVEDQGQKPECTAYSVCKVLELYFQRKGVTVELSEDDLYRQCKLIDGVPNVPGTYPQVAAKVACDSGVATKEAYATGDPAQIAASRALHKAGGYAFVSNDFHSICQAICQNGAVIMSMSVDQNFVNGNVGKLTTSLGSHETILNAYYMMIGENGGMNSWGTNWTGYPRGINDPSIEPGHYAAIYSDIAPAITSIIAFADVPADLIAKAKGTPKTVANAATITRNPNAYETPGTLSAIRSDGQTYSCDTLELIWNNNQHNISCVPTGTYLCKYNSNPALGMLAYELQSVPNRSAVFMHSGNWAVSHIQNAILKGADILGCILLGHGYADLDNNGKREIINSRQAKGELEAFFNHEDFTLTIR